ncbi:hypothetical protein [Bradyrhizobium sp. CCBAU 45384]|uniref:hypothetical protein n=1 Tax=Bradyrhizobium sp. CCBAU 45384 TaxID=858428 RepID=UPI002306418B|nr:hypothetical protein [Bradyrhizobium sp. CCBAU 45384]MDA9405572.1 hypothetical protein [Bradyrhizobium sp. CCBAU 45384]
MRKGGRISAAELDAPRPLYRKSSRLTAPASLSSAERSLFIEIVSACSEKHFTKADLPVLISFIQATLVAREMAGDPARFNSWEKAARLQASLAMRLRLCPSSRLDPKTAGRNQPFDGPRPWLRDEDDDVRHDDN